jgi:hypothetical protein
MNDDALAAVAAAARLLLASAQTEASVPAPACWTIAGRVRTFDADRYKRLAGFRSRWAMMGRLQ